MVAADRAGVGAHRDRLQAHALVGADVADHVAVVGVDRVLDGQVEVVAVLHQELAAAHHPEAGADLVAELPLDVVEGQRQVLVGGDRRAEDVGDQLLVGRAVEHVALVAVLDAQHLGAVVVVAAALAPEVGRLQRRHQERDVAGALLLLVHDLLDAAQHLEAERQPGIDPGLAWRIMPARSISRWLAICASAGVSRRIGRKYLVRRIAAGSGRPRRFRGSARTGRNRGLRLGARRAGGMLVAWAADLRRRDAMSEAHLPASSGPGETLCGQAGVQLCRRHLGGERGGDGHLHGFY